MITVNCVLIGDRAVGKTSTLISYTTKAFPLGLVPMIFDHYNVNMMVMGKPISLGLTDTDADDPEQRQRAYTAHGNVDVFLICFDITNHESFKNVERIWTQEIKEYNGMNKQDAPYLLVGCKADLKKENEDETVDEERSKMLVDGYCRSLRNGDVINICLLYFYEQKPITLRQGMSMRKRIGAKHYVEHSALTQIGLKNVFDTAIETVLNAMEERESKNRSKSCIIL